ncbi:MAG TPA: sigma-70 family RNA polymerase sigma factor [Polyangiaceae bacterium]
MNQPLVNVPLGAEPLPIARDGQRSIEALVREHLTYVYRLLRHLGVPPGDVDDGVQQVFLTLNRKLSEVQAGRERAYVSAVAVRIASRWRRTHRRRGEEYDSAGLAERVCQGLSPEGQLDRAQAEQTLLAILSSLPEKLREVFVLFELEELTLMEISLVLQIPKGTAASRLRLARERFNLEIATLETSGRKP